MSSTYSFHEQAAALFEQLGDHRKMVLSTSADGRVTSRMMSILILSRAFYFQTDQSMRKFQQLKTIQMPRCASTTCRLKEPVRFSADLWIIRIF